MALLPTNRMTLADISAYLGPDNEVQPPIELLAQRGTKELMGYLTWAPGNRLTGEEYSVRTAEPTAHLRDYNEGVPASKSAVAKVTEGMSQIEAWSEIDVDEADLNGLQAAIRAQEDTSFISSIEKKFMDLFYGGNTGLSSKEFNGLKTRLSTLASGHVIDCGGDAAATNTSIFLMQLGPQFHGIYPGNSQAGWKHEDLGRQVIQIDSTNRMLAYTSRFTWKCGLALKNWQRLVRIANIKVADLRARTGTQALTAATNILYALSDATQMLPDSEGMPVFGANRTVIASLMKMGLDKSQSVLDVESGLTQFGKPFSTVRFLGYPFVVIDKITNTETKVT